MDVIILHLFITYFLKDILKRDEPYDLSLRFKQRIDDEIIDRHVLPLVCFGFFDFLTDKSRWNPFSRVQTDQQVEEIHILMDDDGFLKGYL